MKTCKLVNDKYNEKDKYFQFFGICHKNAGLSAKFLSLETISHRAVRPLDGFFLKCTSAQLI